MEDVKIFIEINIAIYLWLIAYRLHGVVDELKNINRKNK